MLDCLSKRVDAKNIFENRNNPQRKLINKILNKSLNLDENSHLLSGNNSILIKNRSKRFIERYVSDFVFKE